MSGPQEPRNQPEAASDAPSASLWEALLERLRSAVAPRFEVERLIGYGGMAGVYLAREPKLGRRVAIKVMSPSLMMDPGLVQRFRQEARTIAQLDHPNIVTIYDVMEGEHLHYFVMAYLPGRTAEHVMRETRGPLPVDVVRAWMYQVGSALDHAHGAGIVHRDVKPSNILLDRYGNALVTDFGIAKVADREGLTRTGMLVGTPAYMSPEQCSSSEVGPASDQYSLGALAYKMLTGEPPFSGPTLAVLHAHVSQEPQPVRAVRPDCPGDLAEAVDRMLAKRPADRWPSVSAAVRGMGAGPVAHGGAVHALLADLAAPVERVTVSSAAGARAPVPAPEVSPGETFVAEAVVQGREGRVLAGRTVAWSCEPGAVARVLPDGRVITIGPGTARVTAECGGVRDSLIVRVGEGAGGAVIPRSVEVAAGASLELAGLLPDEGLLGPEPEREWGSTDPDVARVTPDGRIVALRPGKATLGAFREGRGLVAEITVTPDASAAEGAGGTRASTPIPASRWSARGAAADAPPSPAAPGSPSAPPATSSPGSSAASTPGSSASSSPASSAAPPPPSSAAPTPGSSAAPPAVPTGSRVAEDGSRGKAARRVPGAPTGRRRSLIAAGVVGLAALLVAAVFLVPRGGGPPGDGGVRVVGLPPGARAVVVVEGSEIELTPGEASALPPGTYEARVTAPGFEPFRADVSIASGAVEEWRPSLVETSVAGGAEEASEGTLRVLGLPSAARVALLVDGEEVSVGPTGELALPPGPYEARVTAEGFEPYRETVELEEGETLEWRPALVALAEQPAETATDPGAVGGAGTGEAEDPEPGTVRASGLPDGASAVLSSEGRSVPLVEGTAVPVPVGTWRARVTAPGYEQFEEVLSVEAGAVVEWRPILRAEEEVADPVEEPEEGPSEAELLEEARLGADALLRAFAAAFAMREMSAVLEHFADEPGDWAAQWRPLVEDTRNASDLRAEVRERGRVELESPGRAVTSFSLALSYRDFRNNEQNPLLTFRATIERGEGGWHFVELDEGSG